MFFIEISKYLDVVSPFLLLLFVAITPGVTSRKDYIFWFLVIQLLFNSLSTIIQLFDGNNLVVYNANCIISFLILSVFFSSILQLNKIKIIVPVVSALFLVISVINGLVFENIINEFNSIMYGLAAFIIVVYCFLYYLQNLLNPTQDIMHSRDFWYVTGFLTYYTSSFFIFVTFNYLTQSNNSQYNNGIKLLWPIHNLFFLVMCGYLLKGMLCKRSLMKYI